MPVTKFLIMIWIYDSLSEVIMVMIMETITHPK